VERTHVRRAKERGAGVAARNRHDGRHHQVLDEGARDDDLNRHPLRLAGSGNGRRFAIRNDFHALRHVELLVGLVAEEVDRGRAVTLRVSGVRQVLHGGPKRLADGDVHMLVHLLVVDDDVVHVGRDRTIGQHLGRGHAVELADLGGALEHLDRVGVVVDLVLRGRREEGKVEKGWWCEQQAGAKMTAKASGQGKWTR
jgi:hypothetical protein